VYQSGVAEVHNYCGLLDKRAAFYCLGSTAGPRFIELQLRAQGKTKVCTIQTPYLFTTKSNCFVKSLDKNREKEIVIRLTSFKKTCNAISRVLIVLNKHIFFFNIWAAEAKKLRQPRRILTFFLFI